MNISTDLALFIFGLKTTYSQNDVSEAYRRLAKITHPDSGGDNNLFILIKECKELLEKNIQNNTAPSKNTTKTNPSPQNNVKNMNIELNMLYEQYDILEKYIKEFNISDITSNMYISINPIFKKSLSRWADLPLKSPFKSFLNTNQREIIFEETIRIPPKFEKYKFFKVFIQIEEKKYHFFISKNTFKEFTSLNAFKKTSTPNLFLTTIRLSFKSYFT